jgi:antitoxin component of RelBE/YafQ-DinJ toxin-antitoxin module
MDTTILQIPISKSLRTEAVSVAKDSGFSSLQEVVRLMLTKFARKEIGVTFERFPAVKLSAKNDRRYAKMVDDVLSGRVKTKSFDNVDDLMKDLKK